MLQRSLLAFFKGISLCLFVPAIRRVVILPWIIGLLCYPITLYAAYSLHSPIVSYLASPSEGFFATALYWLSWLAVSGVLLISTLFISVLLVLISTAAFQTAIVEQVIRHELPESPLNNTTTLSISVIISQSFRAIATESIKLLWLIPLFITVFILGFIPFLAPFAFLLAAWLLAFQFIDIVLDVAQFPATKRIKYTAKNWIAACSFGFVITIIFLIPFAGIVLGPIATAGAAWMLTEQKELWLPS